MYLEPIEFRALDREEQLRAKLNKDLHSRLKSRHKSLCVSL